MTSQLNVDTIVDKAGSGGTNVKIGNTSTYVSDGGGATQNIVQGLAKVWQQAQGDSTVTDSFNVASMTDSGTGTFTTNFTNAMNNAFYSGLSTGMSGDHLISNVSNTQSGQCRFDHYSQSNSSVDTGLHCVGILGDLA